MAITFAAGQRITAASLNAFVPYYVRQGTDQNLTTVSANSNTFTSLAINAGEAWAMDFFLDYGGFSVATNNVQLSWSVTGGLTGDRLMTTGVAAASGSTTDSNGHWLARPFNQSTSYSGTVNTTTSRGMARQSFVVTATTAGTMTLALIMSAGTGIAYTGSYMTGRRIS